MKNYCILILTSILVLSELFCQDDVFVYPSMAEVDVEINCQVIKNDTAFSYNYTIKNSETSKQKIYGFIIKKFSNLRNIKFPNGWDALTLGLDDGIFWCTPDSSYYISIGNTLTGLKFTSLSLPSIIKYYIKGYVPIPHFEEGEIPEKIVNDSIFENSKKGFIVGPRDIPDSADINDLFGDVLEYVKKSQELGWIADRQTAIKYDNYISNARQSYTSGMKNAARSTLFKVLDECMVDKGFALTSEAFALIYYNSEYISEKLK